MAAPLAPRSIGELLHAIDTPYELPLSEEPIAAAYRDGRISPQEARRLQEHARMPWRAQKRALAAQRLVSAGDVAKVREKLDKAFAALESRRLSRQ